MAQRKEPNPNTAYGRKRIRENELQNKVVTLSPEGVKKNTLYKKKTALPPKEPNYTIIKFLFFGVIIAYALWQTYGKNNDKPSGQLTNSYSTQSPSDIPEESTAYQISQSFVIEKLGLTSTADFRSSAAVFVKNPIDSTYKILSFLDVENSDGTKLRNNFTIRMKYTGGDEYNSGNWELISLDLKQ